MVEHEMIIGDGSTINMEVGTRDQYNLNFGSSINPSYQPTTDYNTLLNKPQINGVTLQDNVSLINLDLQPIYVHTTEYWNLTPSLQSLQGAFYVYTDYRTIEEDEQIKYIPGIKIGDGDSYVVDLPFITDLESEQIDTISNIINTHIAASDIHITDAEREFWNNKVTASLNPNDPTNLILSKL